MKKICALIIFICYAVLAQAQSDLVQKSPSLQQGPFGEVALLSCSNALRTHAPIYMGLEITPQPDWDIQLENLTLSTSENIPIDWFTPFTQPLIDRSVYPISAVLPHTPKEAITFTATGTIKACLHNDCATHPFTLSKTLGTELALILPECDGITRALTYTPVPMYMGKVKGWAVLDNDQNIRVTLDFQKFPKTIQIYDSNKQLLSLDIQSQQNRAQFLWPWKQEDLSFFVRTYYGYYEIKLPILPAGTRIPMPNSVILKILQTVILFFLLSAFPIFWARSTDTNRKIFLRQTKQSLCLVCLTGIILAAIVAIRGPLNLAFLPIGKSFALIGMALGLLFVPAHISMPFLFTLIAPRPYLAFIQTIPEQLLFILTTTFFIALTFVAQWIWSKKIFKILNSQEWGGCIWWCARLPWLAFIIYLIFYL